MGKHLPKVAVAFATFAMSLAMSSSASAGYRYMTKKEFKTGIKGEVEGVIIGNRYFLHYTGRTAEETVTMGSPTKHGSRAFSKNEYSIEVAAGNHYFHKFLKTEFDSGEYCFEYMQKYRSTYELPRGKRGIHAAKAIGNFAKRALLRFVMPKALSRQFDDETRVACFLPKPHPQDGNWQEMFVRKSAKSKHRDAFIVNLDAAPQFSPTTGKFYGVNEHNRPFEIEVEDDGDIDYDRIDPSELPADVQPGLSFTPEQMLSPHQPRPTTPQPVVVPQQEEENIQEYRNPIVDFLLQRGQEQEPGIDQTMEELMTAEGIN